jgi:hypothetical protein
MDTTDMSKYDKQIQKALSDYLSSNAFAEQLEEAFYSYDFGEKVAAAFAPKIIAQLKKLSVVSK